MTNISERSALAHNIANDILNAGAFAPHAEIIGRDLELAYGIQADVVRRLVPAVKGRTIAGYKMAFNKASSMQYYNIDEPCYAPVFSDLIRPSGSALALAQYNDLFIEAELIVTLGADVPGDIGKDREAIAACVSSVRPGFELLDPRGAFAHDPTAAIAIAQCIYNVGAIVGGPGVALTALDLAAITTVLTIDGVVQEQVTAAAPQDLFDVVAWLAKTLARDGTQLRAGMIILCGTHFPVRSIKARSIIDVSMSGLGSASFTLT